MRHIIPISGKDSLATALLQTAYQPELNYEFMFNDTGCELPEVYAWLERVEQQTGWNIHRIGEPLEDIVNGYNGFLPGQRSRYCTKMAKIIPFQQWAGDSNEDVFVYYGLRQDEQRTGYVPLADSHITPKYPLRSQADGGITPRGFDLKAVYALLQAQDLMPPSFHWQRLYDAVATALRDLPDWETHLEPWHYPVFFGGRSRGNCYFCFYQSQYEFVWLYETHPDYYWRAAAFEKTQEQKPKATRRKKASAHSQLALLEVESAPVLKTYTWRQEFSLRELAGSEHMRASIFNRRVADVSKAIVGLIQKKTLGLAVDTEIAMTSCGLLCGK